MIFVPPQAIFAIRVETRGVRSTTAGRTANCRVECCLCVDQGVVRFEIRWLESSDACWHPRVPIGDNSLESSHVELSTAVTCPLLHNCKRVLLDNKVSKGGSWGMIRIANFRAPLEYKDRRQGSSYPNPYLSMRFLLTANACHLHR
jgi:hypothetical protein